MALSAVHPPTSMERDPDNPLDMEFEGSAVVEVGFEVSNAGGGLQKSLDVDEHLMTTLGAKQIGDRVRVVMDLDVTKIRHQPVKGAEDKIRRVCITRCVEAAVLDGAVSIKAVEKALDEQRKRRELAIDEAKQRRKLPGIDDPEDPGNQGDPEE